MNIKEIKEVIALMNENNLTEIEIEKDGTRIHLKKASGSQFEVVTAQSGDRLTRKVIDAEKDQISKVKTSAEKEKKGLELIEVKAPMVGTFYQAPSPESPPYVEINQTITAGQVICIIEAMKLMNEIKSEHNGKVVEISVNDAQAVEYGQLIMKLEPTP